MSNFTQTAFRILATASLLSAFVGLSACSDRTTEQERNAIERVLDQNSRKTENASTVDQVVAEMRKIDHSDCPSDFREAILDHIHAWELLNLVEKEARQFNASFNSPSALLEAALRGATGDPLGKGLETSASLKQLEQNFNMARVDIVTTYHRVEEVAVAHGARLPTKGEQNN